MEDEVLPAMAVTMTLASVFCLSVLVRRAGMERLSDPVWSDRIEESVPEDSVGFTRLLLLVRDDDKPVAPISISV